MFLHRTLLQTAPEWRQGAFEIRCRPRPDPHPVSRAVRAQKKAVPLIVSPTLSQEDVDSKMTPLQQHPQTHTRRHTPRPSERPVTLPISLAPRGTLDPLPNPGVGEQVGEVFPLFAGSGSGPAAVQERDADAHSRRLCEELRSHGGDRYSRRDARGRRPTA